MVASMIVVCNYSDGPPTVYHRHMNILPGREVAQSLFFRYRRRLANTPRRQRSRIPYNRSANVRPGCVHVPRVSERRP